MSTDLAQVVFCDHEDCTRAAFYTVSSHAEARVAASCEGWEYEDGNDLCPGHNTTGGPF